MTFLLINRKVEGDPTRDLMLLLAEAGGGNTSGGRQAFKARLDLPPLETTLAYFSSLFLEWKVRNVFLYFPYVSLF